jgi:acetylornithine deacetylase
VDPVALARTLIDIDSTSGLEGEVGRALAQYLRGRGYSVLEQPLPETVQAPAAGPGGADGGPPTTRPPRVNVIAAVGEPRLVFSTHLDCVPPFFPSRIEDGRVYGRGACDAKGILAAQVAAAERLRAAGETRVGLLFVAGEERGSDGARAANTIASGSRYLINGEPTDLRLGSATRGCFRVRLVTDGRAAHSGYPELGESAIEKLLDVLAALRTVVWPADPQLGTTHYTVGLIRGGVAPNVVPPHAEAEVFFRTVGPHEGVRARLASAVAGRARIDEILELPVVRLHTLPGFEIDVFSFFSDVPFLTRWGTPLLVGPGSIHVAHTDHEHVAIDELHRAVDLYERLAKRLLVEG